MFPIFPGDIAAVECDDPCCPILPSVVISEYVLAKYSLRSLLTSHFFCEVHLKTIAHRLGK